MAEPSILMTGAGSYLISGFNFLEVLQIVLLGDYHLLFSFVPSSFTAGGLEDSLLFYHGDARHSKSLSGDPIKNTMRLQMARKLPIITAIPVVITIALLVMNLAFLSLQKGFLEFQFLNGGSKGTSRSGVAEGGPPNIATSEEALNLQKLMSDKSLGLNSFSKNKMVGQMPGNSQTNINEFNGNFDKNIGAMDVSFGAIHSGLGNLGSLQMQKVTSDKSGETANLNSISQNKFLGHIPESSFINFGGINGAQTMVQLNENSVKKFVDASSGGQDSVKSSPGNSFINFGGINGAQTMVQLHDSSIQFSSGANEVGKAVQMHNNNNAENDGGKSENKGSVIDPQDQLINAEEIKKNEEVQQKQLFKSYFG